jgi:hypothetical protein
MKHWMVLAGMMIVAPVAFGECGPGSAVRDWALHREWRIACDGEHPERPATLVEVPWTPPTRDSGIGTGRAGGGENACAPEVRRGMRVILGRDEETADVHLSGIALGTACRGQKVKVRAGLGAVLLEGIVRGPALVELATGEEWH